MLAHLMVKDRTMALSDHQGPSHASFDSKDEVSTLSDPKAWAATLRMRFPPCLTPRGQATPHPISEDKVSALSDPKAWALTRQVPREGLRLVRPPKVGFRLVRPLGRDFCLAYSLGVRFATEQKQWP